MAEADAAARTSTRTAVVGLSLNPTCGVRDHAELLAGALAEDGASTSFHWLLRRERSLRASWSEIRPWTLTLARELTEQKPDAILLHYSVFTLSHKGLPVFVGPVLSTVRSAGVPVVTVMHEFAYPWRYGGWRGGVWAVTQRGALIDVVRSSDGLIVTAAGRERWLRSRVWLPRRPVLSAPVFSNLPPPAAGAPGEPDGPTVGLFGYSYQGAACALVLDALASVRAQGIPARLTLLGAPGPESPAGRAWRSEAAARGLLAEVSFTGPLPSQELSDALASCDLLLFADTAGPSPRKGTLAGSLASGRPVVAIDGPLTWPELVGARALALAPPTAEGLGAAIAALLGDEAERTALGARGRAFSEREMGVSRTARATQELLGRALARREA